MATSKSLYRLICGEKDANQKIKDKWENILGAKLDWHRIWNTLNSNAMSKFHYDIIYKLIQHCSAVKHNLKIWKITDDEECPKCGCIDNIVHAFHFCSSAKTVLIALERYTMKIFNRRDFKMSLFHTIFGFRYDRRKESRLGILLWSYAIAAIWKQKNLSYHDKYVDGRKIFIGMIVNRIQDEYEVARTGSESRRNRFREFWTAGDMLVDLDHNFNMKIKISR